MFEQNKMKHGQICWYELTTKDSAKAQEFYKNLLNWKFEQSPNSEMDYQYMNVNGANEAFGGVMQMNEEWGDEIPSHWMTYITVEDVDATCEKVKEMGGNVCVPPTDIPVGRFSVINDPSGATFSIIKLNVK